MKKFRYPGARPFTSEQTAIFFGRDKEKKEMLQLIDLEQILLLHSKSGMGKSSLINAGVIPELTKNGSDDPMKSTAYVPILFRFGAYTEDNQDTPFRITRRRIRMEHPIENSFLEKILPGDRSLWAYLKNVQICRPQAKGFVLIFDQFEELFTYPKEQVQLLGKELASAFFEEIPQRFINGFEQRYKEDPSFLSEEEMNLLHEPFNLKIIFSIRSDRMSLMDKLKRFFPTILKNTYELEALSIESAEEAIINPAYSQEKGFISPTFDYSDEALEYILSYLTKSKTQKIESFQLQILCQYVEAEVMEQNLKEVTKENLGDLDEIYANYYGNQIAKLPDEEDQLAARRFIEEGLILEEEKRRLSLHESQILSFYGISRELLRKLVDTHLIRREPTTKGGYIYELSHDSIVAPILKAKKERRKKEEILAEERRKKEEAARLQKLEEERKKDKKRLATLQRANIATILAVLLTIFGGIWFIESTRQSREDAEKAARLEAKELETRKFAESNRLTSQAMLTERVNRTKALQLIKEAREENSENPLANRVLNELLITSKSYPFYQHELKGHTNHISSIDITEDGQWIISGGKDSRIIVWTTNGDTLDINQSHEGIVNSVEFSMNGKQAVSASDDEKAIVWNVTNEGALVDSAQLIHTQSVNDASFSSDGRSLITCQAGLGHAVKLWRKKRDKWNLVDSINTTKNGTMTAGLLTKGVNFEAVYSGESGFVEAYSFKYDTSRVLLDLGADISVNTIALSENESYLAAGLDNGMIKLVNFKTGKEIITFFAHDAALRDIHFGVDGKSILSCGLDKKAKHWDLNGRLLTTYLGNRDGVTGVATDEKGKYIVTGGEDKVIKVWEQVQYYKYQREASKKAVMAVDFSDDGKYMATGSLDQQVKIYEVATGELFARFSTSGNINALCFLPGTKLLAAASGRKILLFNVNTRKQEQEFFDRFEGLKGWQGYVMCLAPHPSNPTLLVAGNRRGHLVVWDHTKGEVVKENREAHPNEIFDLAFSSSGKYLITGSKDRTARIWDFSNLNDPITKIEEHEDFVRAVAGSPVTDTLFLTGSWDNTIKLWNLKGERLQNFEGHTSDVSSLDFSDSGNEFISASSDETVRIWRIDGGEMPSIIQHDQSIRAAVYSPGKAPEFILTGCKDGTARLWETNRAETLLEELDNLNQ
jgi:WD40 repeat protein